MSEIPKIIVLGIGNILMSDEGVGVRALERLKEKYSFPENVEMHDGGTTGLHGLLPLVEEADHLVVIDAVNGEGEAGTLYRYTSDDFKKIFPKKLSAHEIGFMECLTVAELNGRLPKSVIIIGIKPEDMQTPNIGLTSTIKLKVDELAEAAAKEIESLGVHHQKL